ncbi:MAG: A/G-specific adenine glycosylase [Gammaproteobacteria bacterium]|nr:A/G-specific adenine glycosylase [Gammaproteobacteria bacterium]
MARRHEGGGGGPVAAAASGDPGTGGRARLNALAPRLLAWWDRHGRKDLPWQCERNAYRVWISEVMLQQTRVATVIPYFERFVARFPDAGALASASLDEVLRHWSGLGYYARARNLHAAARAIAERHAGELPADPHALTDLPGIGRSTAGAILALAHARRAPILDGNVKRVLARYHAIDGWPGDPAVTRALWTLAEAHTPRRRVAAYTQAIMDLGATVCTRARPRCSVCPLAADCRARADERTGELPAARPRRTNPTRSTRLLLLRGPDRSVLLERRPPSGIWGGLWSLPECPPEADLVAYCRARYAFTVTAQRPWPALRHSFTHFHLDITPVLVDGAPAGARALDAGDTLWYNGGRHADVGLAAPVAALLRRLEPTAKGDPT